MRKTSQNAYNVKMMLHSNGYTWTMFWHSRSVGAIWTMSSRGTSASHATREVRVMMYTLPIAQIKDIIT